MIGSYPKVWAVGHPQVADLFLDPVLVEEKVDGSQFSFLRPDLHEDLEFRSKGARIHVGAVPKLFELAVETVRSLQDKLTPGWVYRAEALHRPRHNVLAYDRVPRGGLVLFDVTVEQETYLSPAEKELEASRLGLECVPSFGDLTIATPDDVLDLLETESFLGGPKIEGLVFKNYRRWGRDGKALMGKYVSEKFKEKHRDRGNVNGPAVGRDILKALAERYRTEARWQKEVQHLREAGELSNEPKDIGPLLRELSQDFEAEEQEDVKEALWAWARKGLLRAIGKGLPEWYKQRLLDDAFGGGAA